jgi:MoxR-like ATPase
LKQELLNYIDDLEDVTGILKSTFVAKDEIIEIMVICAIAQEHMLIVGPPGTAKSELVKRFARLCSPRQNADGNVPYFEYLLTRFTEPNEIFGAVDIKRFQEEGKHRRITDGMLPRAEIVFLDEVFKANSAILNALLNVLNERVYYNAGLPEPVPLLCAIGASNEVPDDPTLAALFDRFLLRLWTDNVEEARFGELFQHGWQLVIERIQKGFKIEQVNVTTIDNIRKIHRALDEVNLDGVSQDYREAVRRIRAEGIELSDRRVINLLKLIAASALRRKSLKANTGDFWVLKHIWNNPDQIPHLQTIINPYLEEYEGVQWSAERDIETIEGDINVLATRQKHLKTDADYADFLQQAERLRRELLGHSVEPGTELLIDRLEALIEEAMTLLEKQN